MAAFPPLVLALLALLVVGGVIHAAFLLVAYRRGDLSDREVGADFATEERADSLLPDRESGERAARRPAGSGSTIRCPRCRAVNDAEYSYCRACVADLRG